MPEPNQTTIRLRTGPGVLTVTGKWLGLEGDQEEVYNKYMLAVDDIDITVEYKYLAPLPERGNRMRKRLSVQELARGFWEMLESALLVDTRLLLKLHDLDIDPNSIPAMMEELQTKYDL